MRARANYLAHQRVFHPETWPKPRTENSVTEILVCTTSGKKWSILQPLIQQAGFTPTWDKTPNDEGKIHRILRIFSDFDLNYPVNVARMKLPFSFVIPALALDTVTIVNKSIVEKPHTSEEARLLIARLSGQQIVTDTGWVFRMQLKSGNTAQLLNRTKITYTVQKLSSKDINYYVTHGGNILNVPAGLDLTTPQARSRFINMNEPVIVQKVNNLGHKGFLNLRGNNLQSPIFDAMFAGVPVHAIRTLLPSVNDIYLHGDPFYQEETPPRI